MYFMAVTLLAVRANSFAVMFIDDIARIRGTPIGLPSLDSASLCHRDIY
jgi:hypothetical protein